MALSTDQATGVLRAGGLLPAEAPEPTGERIDRVSARRYAHPALGERPVVQLVPDALAASEDLAMELLGFERGTVAAGVAKQRQRALGFPGWALVNDPARARYALDVMKRFKDAARRARSKPGHAKDAFDAIGDELGRSVPHFLPSYYEEVGRAFIEQGNAGYAAQAFAKAREAERVHALPVDWELRSQVFLDFALAGAISVKSLTEYARDLEKGEDKERAHEHLIEVCAQRTLGGLPPWGGMAKDLRRLARAAGRSQDDEDRRFLARVIDAPSLVHAPVDFFASYRKPLCALARSDARVRGAMLHLLPVAPGFDAEWLAMLEEAGALDSVIAPAEEVPAEASPRVGAAAWLGRLIEHCQRDGRRASPPALFTLLRRMAPRLRAEGAEVTFDAGRHWRFADVDLVDLALELGIPVAAPAAERTRINLLRWGEPPAGSSEHGRDPVYLANDARFDPLLRAALDQAMTDPRFERAARGKKGLAGARRAWLAREIERLGSGGLPDAEDAIAKLAMAASPETFREMPDLLGALRGTDVANALARTLRVGLLDELGFPPLEEACDELAASGGAVQVGGSFPYLVAVSAARAIVVGPAGRLFVHDLALPPRAQLVELRYAGGQLLVAYRTIQHKGGAYWSGSPNDHFETKRTWGQLLVAAPGIEVAGGGITWGDRALHPGDRHLPDLHASVFSDGATVWRTQWDAGKMRLREIDPASGEPGRFSLPAFFEAFAEAGWNLGLGVCRLQPCPPGVEASPLGSKDGLLGFRCRTRVGTARVEAEGIDGRRFEGDCAPRVPFGLLSLPGDERPRVLFATQQGIELRSPGDGAFAGSRLAPDDLRYARGTRSLLPLHLLRPRDEAGSRALRALTDDAARAILAAARQDKATAPPLPVARRPQIAAWRQAPGAKPEAVLDLADWPLTATAIERAVPDVTHPGLRTGIAGVAVVAREIAKALEALLTEKDSARAGEVAPVRDLDPTAIDAALALPAVHYNGTPAIEQMPVVARFLALGGDAPRLEPAKADWTGLVSGIGAVAFRAVSIGTGVAERARLLDFLAFFAATPFAEAGPRLRVATVKFATAEEAAILGGAKTGCLQRNGRRYFFLVRSGYHATALEASVIEHADDGVFALLPGSTLVEERPVAAEREWLRRFVELAGARGAVPHAAEIAQAIAARTGLSEAQAALVWAGFPNVDVWTKTFLPKPLREALGLKVAEADAARQALRAIPAPRRLGLLAAAMPDDPAFLWEPLGGGEESAVARLSRKWVESHGRWASLRDELLTRAKKELGAPPDLLALFADPAAAPELNVDAPPAGPQKVIRHDPGARGFSGHVLAAAVPFVPWLFSTLPVGDPLRANIPEVVDRLRARLASPDLLVYAGLHQSTLAGGGEQLLQELGGEPVVHADQPGREARDNGRLLAVNASWAVQLFLRPSRVDDADVALVERLATRPEAAFGAYRLFRSSGFAELAARVRETPVPPGGFEANPLLSAAGVVERVRARYGLAEDAAVLYLQTLALLAPTTANVREWNGWTAARIKKAAAELGARELLVEAKRARAGRSHFLPGAWEALRPPDPSFESWKMPLYDLRRTATGIARPFGRILPLRPLHRIFEAAWERIEGGDAPRFEEVRR